MLSRLMHLLLFGGHLWFYRVFLEYFMTCRLTWLCWVSRWYCCPRLPRGSMNAQNGKISFWPHSTSMFTPILPSFTDHVFGLIYNRPSAAGRSPPAMPPASVKPSLFQLLSLINSTSCHYHDRHVTMDRLSLTLITFAIEIVASIPPLFSGCCLLGPILANWKLDHYCCHHRSDRRCRLDTYHRRRHRSTPPFELFSGWPWPPLFFSTPSPSPALPISTTSQPYLTVWRIDCLIVKFDWFDRVDQIEWLTVLTDWNVRL